MAERRTRRSFTREFKAQAVKRLLDGGKGLSEVATELGISTGQLSQWRTEHLAAGSAEALAARKAEQAETQRLKREVKRLEEEVEILRKAAAFFARGIAWRRCPSCQLSGQTMPWRRCAGSSARASPAFTLGCARSRPFRAGLRWKPNCASTSAASLPPPAGSMAHLAFTPSCAGRGVRMRDGGSRLWASPCGVEGS